MEPVQADMIRLGFKLMASCCFLLPSYFLYRQSLKQYHETSNKLRIVKQSTLTKSHVTQDDGKTYGVVTVVPQEKSVRKSFKYTNYCYNHVLLQNYANVSGSFFTGNLASNSVAKPSIFKKNKVLVDLKCFTVHKSALTQNIKPLNPKNVWSDMLDASLRRLTTTRNQYSLCKVELGLTLGSVAIFGQIQIGDPKDITKIIPDYISTSYAQITEYYQRLIETKAIGTFFGGLFVVASVAAIYYLFRNEIAVIKKRFLQLFKPQRKEIKADFLLSDPADKLHCKICKDKFSNAILQCAHLCICQDCYHVDNSCPICKQASSTYTKIFI